MPKSIKFGKIQFGLDNGVHFTGPANEKGNSNNNFSAKETPPSSRVRILNKLNVRYSLWAGNKAYNFSAMLPNLIRHRILSNYQNERKYVDG